MQIKNPEALKSWLVVVLEPLCDADSSALARYVLALLKKDKPEKELKKLMKEQLDVFLAEETKPFVERLFGAINSEDYFSTMLLPDNKLEDDPISAAECSLDRVQMNEISQEGGNENLLPSKPIDIMPPVVGTEQIQTPPIDENVDKELLISGIADNQKSNITTQISSNTAIIKTETTSIIAHTYTSTYAHHMCSLSPPIRENADKENQPRENRRRRSSLHSRSRTRSRSKSNERLSRRSRSRDRRINEREKIQRQFRNKSPPTTDLRHVGGYERRRGGSGNERKRAINSNNMTGAGERSPRFSGNAGEGSTRKKRQIGSNSRSRSSSLERRIKGSPNTSRSARTSPDRHNHHCHDQHETEKRQRCRDFDEKGYCVRGETCPWDHGINPVVFEDINNSALIGMSLPEYNPDSPDLWMRSSSGAMVSVSPTSLITSTSGIVRDVNAPGINPFTGVARGSGILPMTGVSTSVAFPQVGPASNKLGNNGTLLTAAYTRSTNTGPDFRVAAPMLSFPFNATSVTAPLQRELIPIPVVDPSNQVSGGDINQVASGKRRFDLEDSVAIAEAPTKRKLPINSRLGPRLPNIQNNCSLELRKIPRGLNTIAHLNNHFAKFGKIVNIQISYDGDPEAAIVTFSTHAEANVAYRSTEAVLNNRFIKVFWHNQDSVALINDNSPISLGGLRKNSQYHLNNIPAVPTPTSDSAKISNEVPSKHCKSSSGNTANGSTTNESSNPTNITTLVAAAHVPPTSLRLKNNVSRSASNAIIRKKQEEQAKAVVQLANGLRKRKQELLQSYVKQMKSALELVERCDQNDPQRTKTLDTIKVLQETIDKLRKEIAAEQEQIQAHIQTQQPPHAKKTKEQQKKELLDIELELIAQQQEGNDTTVIQRRLEDLQRSLGIVPGSGSVGIIPTQSPLTSGKAPYFPTSKTIPRKRSSYPEGSTRVDRRPKSIVVTGFTCEESEFVLGHFKHFGEITKHHMDKDINQLIISYATRISAEQAVLRGKVFKDKRLQITWAPVVTTTLPTSGSLAADKLSKSEENSNMSNPAKLITSVNTSDKPCNDPEVCVETLPELRIEDEEDDEESEDRSWRR
ncbi:zinc finger protein swm [Eurosta solidaginis]|uniref:zinc finger protein swm n=1 Tax=Eurosta solidaginis TaxID=178769 RepID=UPI003530A6FA